MSERHRWIRVETDSGHRATAAVAATALGAAVAVVSYYLVRTLVAREPLESIETDEPARLATGRGS